MPLIQFSGLASGIDSKSLIDATIAAENARLDPQREQAEKLRETNDIFGELKTKLKSLKTKADALRAVNGGALSKIGTSTDETVVSVEARNDAVNTSFAVTVTTLAKAATFSYNDTNITSSSAAIVPGMVNDGVNDKITITTGSGTGNTLSFSVTVTNTTSLDSLAQAINSATNAQNRVTATVVNVAQSGATANYKLVLSTVNEGTKLGNISVSTGSLITGASRFTASTTSQADNAVFSVSGVNGSITRSSNKVSDLITGLTLNLNKTSSTAATVTVSDDISKSTATVQEFIDNINEIITYTNENNIVTKESDDPNARVIFGPLALTSADNNIIFQIRSVFSSALASAGSEIKVSPDLGITTERDGTLKFDTAKFAAAIPKEAASVADILSDIGEGLAKPPPAASTEPGGVLFEVTKFNGLIDIIINGNNTLITNINTRIAEQEANIQKRAATLTQTFANLEKKTSELQSQGNQLASILGGSGR